MRTARCSSSSRIGSSPAPGCTPARWSTWRKPGSFMTLQAGRVPVVVVCMSGRGAARVVNVCRHRGHIVAADRGCRETLQCPYHAWTYDLDGTLRRAPRAEREPGFDPAAFGAPPGVGRHVGPVRLRQPGSAAAPLFDSPGRPAGPRRRVRHRAPDAALPLPPRVAGCRELEGGARELPRVPTAPSPTPAR